MIRKMLLGAVVLIALAAAPASAQYPPFVVGPGEVVVGGTVTVQGSACAPGETVVITLTQVTSTRAVGDSVVVATVTADENGAFTASFTIPEGTELGSYSVSSSCGNGVDGTIIEVVGDAVTPPGGGGGGGGGGGANLPRTGADLNQFGLIGVGLLTAGGLILVATKRRRHEMA